MAKLYLSTGLAIEVAQAKSVIDTALNDNRGKMALTMVEGTNQVPITILLGWIVYVR